MPFNSNNRFESLKDSNNSFTKPKKNKKNKREQYSHSKSPKNNDYVNDKRTFEPEKKEKIIFPINEEYKTDEPQSKKWLEICKEYHEQHVCSLPDGCVAFKMDKKTKKTTVSYDGIKWITNEEYKAICDRERERKQQIINEQKAEEAWQRMAARIERELWEDYEQYGEDSIKWQEHMRFIESQREIERLDEMMNENNLNSEYSDEDLDEI